VFADGYTRQHDTVRSKPRPFADNNGLFKLGLTSDRYVEPIDAVVLVGHVHVWPEEHVVLDGDAEVTDDA